MYVYIMFWYVYLLTVVEWKLLCVMIHCVCIHKRKNMSVSLEMATNSCLKVVCRSECLKHLRNRLHEPQFVHGLFACYMYMCIVHVCACVYSLATLLRAIAEWQFLE